MSAEQWAQIERLDLEHVKQKWLGRKSLWRRLWCNVDCVEKEYKQFLYLIATNPGEVVVPWSEDLDDLWHEHILDTQKYAEDCQAIFGRFIHHNPHLAVGSAPQRTAYQKTRRMYHEAFKDRALAGANAASAPFGVGGRPVGCMIPVPIIFCATAAFSGQHHPHGHSPDSHSSGESTGDATGDAGGGASCGGASCGGGSSCGGGGCGGGGCGGG